MPLRWIAARTPGNTNVVPQDACCWQMSRTHASAEHGRRLPGKCTVCLTEDHVVPVDLCL